MMKNYQDLSNFNTLSLPLHYPNFNGAIDNQLFDQFYYLIQNITDYNLKPNLNYKRFFILNFYDFLTPSIPETPCFNLYAKLIINLLNTLSLWLDHSILDLYVYVHIFIFKFIIIMIRFLKKIKEQRKLSS